MRSTSSSCSSSTAIFSVLTFLTLLRRRSIKKLFVARDLTKLVRDHHPIDHLLNGDFHDFGFGESVQLPFETDVGSGQLFLLLLCGSFSVFDPFGGCSSFCTGMRKMIRIVYSDDLKTLPCFTKITCHFYLPCLFLLLKTSCGLAIEDDPLEPSSDEIHRGRLCRCPEHVSDEL